MKNKIKKSVALTLAAFAVFGTFAGCNRPTTDGGDSVIADGKTINIRVTNRGYGSTYIYKIAEKFNELYKDEGYKANVLVPLTELSLSTISQEVYMDKGIDIYISGGATKEGIIGEYGQVYADITDSVYNQKPIKFDGTEENVTIAEKMNKDMFRWDVSYDGKCYGLPCVYNFNGFCINMRALQELGLEVPRTTTEFFACIETIMGKVNETGIFPITYSLSGNSYLNTYLNYWIAQYGGYDEVKEFWTMQDATTGETLAAPYEVFGNESIKNALKHYYRLLDYNIAAFGATTQDFKTAQNQWAQGDAVFYVSGDWAYNEEKIRNANRLQDLDIKRIPMVSELGVKMFGEQTSYGYSADKCEEILCAIIDGADANKNVDVITSEVNAALNVSLKESDVKEICERRCFTSGEADGTKMIISEKSKVKDLCALFLRMMASDEGASLIAHEMMVANPFNLNALSDVDGVWHKSATAIVSSQYNRRLYRIEEGYRYEARLSGFSPLTEYQVFMPILEEELTIFDNYSYAKIGDVSIFEPKARAFAQRIYDHAKAQWEAGKWD